MPCTGKFARRWPPLSALSLSAREVSGVRLSQAALEAGEGGQPRPRLSAPLAPRRPALGRGALIHVTRRTVCSGMMARQTRCCFLTWSKGAQHVYNAQDANGLARDMRRCRCLKSTICIADKRSTDECTHTRGGDSSMLQPTRKQVFKSGNPSRKRSQ